jgi:serine O-acetyltransferase
MIFIFITNKFGGYNQIRRRFKETHSKFLKKVYSFINKGFQYETNSYLPFDNLIEGPVNFLHGTFGVFISENASIGKNCTIFQQVTIGSNMLIDSKGFGCPVIGSNCLIGAGAKIIGNVNIGNNCRIGANAVVTRDLPDNCVIVPGNQVIIQKENLENNIYQKRENGWGYNKDGKFIEEKDEIKLSKLNSLN